VLQQQRPSEESEVAGVLQHMAAFSRPPQLATVASATVSVSPSPPHAEVRVCPLQVKLRRPEESPLEATFRVLEMMETIAANTEEKKDLFVLPELCPIGYSEDTFSRYLPVNERNRALYRNIDALFQQAARKLQVYICYGTIGWDAANRLFIRQVVIDRSGQHAAVYDKIHLCDYGDCSETRFFSPGPVNQAVSFTIDDQKGSTFRFGLLLCADMRYPLLSRKLAAQERVDCILQPAAFARDCSFRTWVSFRESRAVENSVYWIGVNYAGENFGETSVVPPWVDNEHEPQTLGTSEGHLMGRIERSRLEHVRATMPFYGHLMQTQEDETKGN
jgi:predicted amidohydrolase